MLSNVTNKGKVIDRSDWKEFKVSDYFQCSTGNNLNGTLVRQWKNEDDENNNEYINYVTRSTVNNGIEGKISNKVLEKNKIQIQPGNALTIGAEGARTFYQSDPFVSGIKVYILRSSHLAKNIGLFMCAIINSIAKKYSYSNAFVLDKIKNEIVKLPAKLNENNEYEPDWEYMENFAKGYWDKIAERLPKIAEQIKNNKKGKVIDRSNWKEFKVKSLFEIANKKDGFNKFSKVPTEGSTYELISSMSTNNGVCRKIDCADPTYLTKYSCITVSTNGASFDCFYHEHPVATTTDVEVLYNDHLNKMNALFICTILHKEQIKYSYSHKAKNGAVGNTVIKLPAKLNENNEYEPDWEYMENFSKVRWAKIETYFAKVKESAKTRESA